MTTMLILAGLSIIVGSLCLIAYMQPKKRGTYIGKPEDEAPCSKEQLWPHQQMPYRNTQGSSMMTPAMTDYECLGDLIKAIGREDTTPEASLAPEAMETCKFGFTGFKELKEQPSATLPEVTFAEPDKPAQTLAKSPRKAAKKTAKKAVKKAAKKSIKK